MVPPRVYVFFPGLSGFLGSLMGEFCDVVEGGGNQGEGGGWKSDSREVSGDVPGTSGTNPGPSLYDPCGWDLGLWGVKKNFFFLKSPNFPIRLEIVWGSFLSKATRSHLQKPKC